MKLYSVLTILLITLVISSCTSSKLVNEWRRPDSKAITFSKVLVIGMSENLKARTAFENDLVAKLKLEGVKAERSLDAFDETYASLPKNEAQLRVLETELVREDFDAVLVTRVYKQEKTKTAARVFSDLTTLWSSFLTDTPKNTIEDDKNQGIYETYHVYSSLYCSCGDGEEWKSIWRAYIDVKEPKKDMDLIINDGVKKYNKTFIKALKQQNLLQIN